MAAGGRQGQTRVEVLKKLAEVAASDAAHDFKAGGEGERSVFNFNEIFKQYKGIGTPSDPKSASSELDIFFETLNLSTGGQSSDDAFKRLIGIPLAKGTRTGITPLPIFTDDGEVPYTIQTLSVAEGGDEGRQWLLTPQALYEALNRENRGNPLVFTIDAQNCPFYELLLTPGATQHNAIYVRSREGVVDGAAKPKGMDTKAATVVKIITRYDTNSDNIAYHATNLSRLGSLDSRELFFSKYSFFIPPVRTIGGCQSTSIECTDSQMASSSVHFQSFTENKNPYTVPNLSRIILDIIGTTYTTAFLTSKNKEKEYHMSLQFKRAGDWTQTLACLNPERFGLPSSTSIRLVTNDRICLLYALIMGVDVIFTSYKRTEKAYYITTFYKRRGEVSALDLIKERVGPLVQEVEPVQPEFNLRTGVQRAQPADTYLGILPEYIRVREQVHQVLLGRIKREADAIASADSKRKSNESGQKALHNLLKAYTVLTHFRTFCPPMLDDTAECVTYLGELQGLRYTEALHRKVLTYLKQHAALKEIADADATTKGGGKGTHAEKVAHFLQNRFINGKYFPKVIEEKHKIVDLLVITRTWTFSPKQYNENGIGIINYISNLLTPEERRALFTSMLQIRGLIKYTDHFDILMKIAGVLTEVRVEEQKPLTVEEVSTEELLAAMFHVTVTGGGGGGGGGEEGTNFNAEQEELEAAEAQLGDPEHAAAEVSKTKPKSPAIRISDFSTEQIILSQRAQGYFGEAVAASVLGLLDTMQIDRNVVYYADVQLGGSKSRSRPRSKRIPYQSYSHNPLTSFCYILIELNNALSAPESDYYQAHKLSELMEHVVKLCVKETSSLGLKEIYAYLYSMEVFLLEGLSPLLPKLGVNHFMAGVKESFYGFSHIAHASQRIHVPVRRQKELASIRPRTMSEEKRIEHNSRLFVYILQYIRLLETKLKEARLQEKLVTGIKTLFRKTRRKSYSNPKRKSKTRSKSKSKSSAMDPIGPMDQGSNTRVALEQK